VNLDDTIVAISTPPGRGGLGVVRLSGPEAKAIAAPMLRLGGGRQLSAMEPGRAQFGVLVEPDSGERLDEVVVTYFAKPHSYTTDDVIEISCHGSPVVLRHAVELAMAAGARLAEPGEFTMRAFLNGRIDLTQAEAVRDLIESQTLYQAKVAAQQLEGALSHRLQPIKQKLVELIALMEAGIDFADDDVAVMPGEQIVARLAEVREPLGRLAESFAYGKIVHEGLTLAIVGPPNVGKSSLFNRLVERERAIVTATPGTTRDLVTETVAIGGIPVRLVDTAGIRQALDEAESIGVRKSMEALADADLVLVVLDASQFRPGATAASTGDRLPLDGAAGVPGKPAFGLLGWNDRELLKLVAGRSAMLVLNKCDLCSVPPATFAPLCSGGTGSTRASVTGDDVETPFPALVVRRTSALTGEGIAELKDEILRRIHGEHCPQPETGMLTNLRQREQVTRAISALDAAAASAATNTPHEMILLDLYNALRALDEITGVTTADDILDLIFSTFCIGK
jgi:tRNA modification GTPase